VIADKSAALSSRARGGFGVWAGGLGPSSCVGWPSPVGGTAPATGSLPDVPMLAISGELDIRTPTSYATSLAARFPRGQVLVVGATGHSALSTDVTGCAVRTVRAWMTTGTSRRRCPAPAMPFRMLAAFPSRTAGGGGPASASRTLEIAARTARDAEAMWLVTEPVHRRHSTVPGLAGGSAVVFQRTLTLAGYALEPGVELTGRLVIEGRGLKARFVGRLTVGGRRAAQGSVSVEGRSFAGVLGGRRVALRG
jgi:hypothetical protein